MKFSKWCFVHIEKIFIKLTRKEKGTVAKIIFGKKFRKIILLNFKAYSALITAQTMFCDIHRGVNTRPMKNIKEHRNRNTQIHPHDFWDRNKGISMEGGETFNSGAGPVRHSWANNDPALNLTTYMKINSNESHT